MRPNAWQCAVDPRFPAASTFKLSGLQEFLPLRADLLHATSHLRGGVMLPVQQLLPRLLQGIDAALISRQLGFKCLVFLHLALQVGGILSCRKERCKQRERHWDIQRSTYPAL